MKRKPLILSIALLLIVGAALWGVKYRINHPPLSSADEKFRAMVAGADSVQLYQYGCPPRSICAGLGFLKYDLLNIEQTHQLIENLRFQDGVSNKPDAWDEGVTLEFKRQGKTLAFFIVMKEVNVERIYGITRQARPYDHFAPSLTCELRPNFEKPLRNYLDQLNPQRIPPP